ncbi:MAG: 3-deoxy-manno-octulosonate cytidylyltransferase [Bacteroidaceae bacterium]|nr:3-deoxy-manno-octulosonate cytidylyltransferase [Bacteroidaceae bacterium]
MQFLAIIPARYASTRFPGKPLALLGGEPIVQHVYRRAASVFERVAVATDDERIADAVAAFGGQAVMTSDKHRSGTDRAYEAFVKLGADADVVVNIQGDEPFVHTSQLQAIKSLFDSPETDIATLVKPFPADTSWEVLNNPNSPKVVLAADGTALYFSRSVIPFLRGIPPTEWTSRHTYYKHIGLYAYRAASLQRITALNAGVLEQAESLEQLRWLENGLRIRTAVTHIETIGIDTPQDLTRAQQFLEDSAAS